jgi:hypothetical protein
LSPTAQGLRKLDAIKVLVDSLGRVHQIGD